MSKFKHNHLLTVVVLLVVVLGYTFMKNMKYRNEIKDCIEANIKIDSNLVAVKKMADEYKTKLIATKNTLDSIKKINELGILYKCKTTKHETVYKIIDPLTFLPSDSTVVEFSRGTKSNLPRRHTGNGTVTKN